MKYSEARGAAHPVTCDDAISPSSRADFFSMLLAVRRRRDDERGVAVVFLAISITAVLMAAAFAADFGWWYVRVQQAQRAADAAALAGVVWMPGDFAKATTVARTTAAANGFEHGVDGITVVVSVGATERQLAVRIVDSQVTRIFSSVSSSEPVTVGRSSVAQYELPVPLGSPENQLGGGYRGVYVAVNGFCSRRTDGDHISSGYYRPDHANANITCPVPYASSSPSSPVAKNPDYRASGYTYVVEIPPAQTTGCAVANPAPSCSRTATKVTIEVRNPRLLNANDPAAADQWFTNALRTPACPGTPRTTETTFTVYAADDTPLDDSDSVGYLAQKVYGNENAPGSTTWEELVAVPQSSRSGRYLVNVRSKANDECSAWSNAFGLRARVGDGAFVPCNTITALPADHCPQVHGLDAMGVRAYVADPLAQVTCPVPSSNRCSTFYLAQVDKAYQGRRMVVTLFDPGEGAQRIRLLGPSGTRLSFDYDAGEGNSGSVSASSSGLDVSAATSSANFNDRRLELSLTLPDAAGLTPDKGWFKVEYEVLSSAAALTDRTTWGVAIRGAPVHLVV
jgi:hypothetical protein